MRTFSIFVVLIWALIFVSTGNRLKMVEATSASPNSNPVEGDEQIAKVKASNCRKKLGGSPIFNCLLRQCNRLCKEEFGDDANGQCDDLLNCVCRYPC